MLAVFIIASSISAGVHAQAPAGASSEGQVITNSKSQDRAQAKDNAKVQGQVKKAGGDELTSTENDAIGTGKAATAGQNKINARDAKHPNRAQSTQGGTPQ